MSVKRLLVEALTVFAASLVVSMIVTLLWNLVVHKNVSIDWETSCRFAIVLGIILPWVGTRRATGR
jgi:hypothetical protein